MAAITQSAVISQSASGDTSVVTGVDGKRIVVTAYRITNNVATAQAVTWKSGASTALTGAMQLPQAIGGATDASAGGDTLALFMCVPGHDLVLNLSAATAVAGFVTYYFR